MNNKITITNVKDVADHIDYIKRSNINLISIRDTSPGPNQHYYDIIDNASLPNLLVINFDDLEQPLDPKYQRKERPPEEHDIVRILEWAKIKMKENNNEFIIHCTGGVSRSSAVAMLIKYMQDPENALKIINPMIHSPNERILDIGDKFFQTKNLKQPAKDLLKKYDEQWMDQLGKPNSSIF